MSQVLAAAAALSWGAGAAAMPVIGWLWLRAGRRRLAFLPFAGILVAELVVLGRVAARGLVVLLDPQASSPLPGWLGWVAGAAGLAALLSGLARDAHGRDPDRAAEIGFGLFGLGLLLRQLALTV